MKKQLLVNILMGIVVLQQVCSIEAQPFDHTVKYPEKKMFTNSI